ncbi:hypothetical protein GW17_00048278 [Ensete ventricosum]|nr:hypothetical protein GW17_00048278 [Ensete ventricosum]
MSSIHDRYHPSKIYGEEQWHLRLLLKSMEKQHGGARCGMHAKAESMHAEETRARGYRLNGCFVGGEEDGVPHGGGEFLRCGDVSPAAEEPGEREGGRLLRVVSATGGERLDFLVVCVGEEMAMVASGREAEKGQQEAAAAMDAGKYVRYTPEQVEALERVYTECPKPSSLRRQQLVRECPILSNIEPKQIKVWFQNRR